MRLIAVDIGNSATKFGIASENRDEIDQVIVISNSHSIHAQAMRWLSSTSPVRWFVCSVNVRRTRELESWLGKHRPADDLHVIQAQHIDLKTNVESRESLGRDRLVGAWQARRRFPREPLVVIDAGTAVTVDLVDSESVFQGGLIFPGARTMLKMLAQQTAALPDLSSQGIRAVEFDSLTDSRNSLSSESESTLFPIIGRSTQQALLLGVYQTQLSTLTRIVEMHRAQFGRELRVIATGGGMIELQDWLPSDWHYCPNLVLEGALAIAQSQK